jgi:hypothetical protein
LPPPPEVLKILFDQGTPAPLRRAFRADSVDTVLGLYYVRDTVANSILGRNTRVVRAVVEGSVVGDDEVIEDRAIKDSVLDAGGLARAR